MWQREGQRVAGLYLKRYAVSGTVINSRVKYGGTVQHTVELDEPIEVFGRVADTLLLDESDLMTGRLVDIQID